MSVPRTMASPTPSVPELSSVELSGQQEFQYLKDPMVSNGCHTLQPLDDARYQGWLSHRVLMFLGDLPLLHLWLSMRRDCHLWYNMWRSIQTLDFLFKDLQCIPDVIPQCRCNRGRIPDPCLLTLGMTSIGFLLPMPYGLPHWPYETLGNVRPGILRDLNSVPPGRQETSFPHTDHPFSSFWAGGDL